MTIWLINNWNFVNQRLKITIIWQPYSPVPDFPDVIFNAFSF